MNIAEILKYCETGMKLYSSVHGEVEFICINKDNEKYPIICKDKIESEASFTSNGRYYYDYPNAECVLFPSKTQKDWNKFRLHVKNGDIMMLKNGTRPFIFRKYLKYSTGKEAFISDFYCGITKSNELEIKAANNPYWTMDFIIPASEEAKKELFDKIAEAGYKWNAETLKLEKIEIKYRPFANKEECWQEMLKHQPFGWIKEDVDNCNIIHIGRYGINLNIGIGNDYRNYKKAFNLKFIDGTPFGIKE